MDKYAIIVAGGIGARMGADVPKQFLLLHGQSLLWHSIQAFLAAYPDIHLIIVLPEAHFEKGKAAVAGIETHYPVVFAAGGETRFHSVQNGLKHVAAGSIVFVHDAVRSLVSKELIQRCYEQALSKGSAIPAVAATDSIRILQGDHHTVSDRNLVRIIQTPQTFRSDILLPAFERPYQVGFTDEATVAEANGATVYLVEGEHENIKITRPADLIIAETILKKA